MHQHSIQVVHQRLVVTMLGVVPVLLLVLLMVMRMHPVLLAVLLLLLVVLVVVLPLQVLRHVWP
jgi:hypothetical protein